MSCHKSQFDSADRLEHIIFSGRGKCKGILLAPFTIYFDDSGTHPGAPVAIAAAWISPFEQWKKFSREWDKLRREEGFDCFHMSEFIANNKDSEFSDRNKWNDKRKAKVLRRIRHIIKTRAVQGFSLAIAQRDFDELMTDDLREYTGRYHYTWAVQNVIGLLENWRASRSKEPVEYIFDWMAKGPSKKEITSVFDGAADFDQALHKYGIYKGCHSFRDKHDVLPLQAADILAWTSFQRAQFEFTKKPMHPLAIESFNDFVRTKRCEAGYITRKQLADWIAKNPKPRASAKPLHPENKSG